MLGVLAVVAVIAAAIAGPVDARWGRGRTSPRTHVLSPQADEVIDGGGILAIGRASHRVGVAGVRVVVKNLDTDVYWNGADWQADYTTTEAAVDDSGERKAAWTLRVSDEVLVPGRYRVRGFAYSVEGNGDAYGGDLVEFNYQSEPGGSTTTTTVGTSTTEPPMTVTTVPTTKAPTSTTASTSTSTSTPTTSTSTSVKPPVGNCGNLAILEPCEGLLLGSTGDFADADGNWQSPRQDFRRQEARLGHDFDIFHEYNQWRELVERAWPNPETQQLADEGRIIFTNWKSPTSHPDDWARIAVGAYDADINKAAQRIIDFADPVFITFFHEPEDNIKKVAGDDIAKQDALISDYTEAFAHIVRVFDQAGADNAIWVWNIQGWMGHERLYEAGLYPGDDVVDWVAYNAYNWHGCDNHGDSRRWREFYDVYLPFYQWLETDGPGRPATDKPIMLGEWGTEENDNAENSDQRKGEWIDGARHHFANQTFPRIKAAVYFDTEGVRADGSIQFCRWALDSSSSSLDSFRNLMADSSLEPSWE